ncbi:MAG: NAD(+)/NADH kinase [Deltaproteobacteria bacterium]|nr:NAD(+)/NADH kinase [Deltaproteobacteria bacterium]MBW2015338.1 NAD(+)/NADH kinase [Deltaproteobacteria bacterium]MBW2128199.1 NAD(+)/NADH kinase [Deltaproteobacteria bacterium]MBW2303084.1 NAD(+)/NADH kinase [Deltaproteobacteria bacterium]
MKARTVGIFFKHNHEPARIEAHKLKEWLEARNYEVFMDSMNAEQNEGSRSATQYHERVSKIPSNVGWVVVLGGDGTLLGAARKVGKFGMPILGVNLGGLGFLTEVPLKRLYPVVEMMLKGQLDEESRLMLETRVVRGGQNIGSFLVLNDVVINKGALARILDLDVYINDQFLTAFRSDGLIISTPTGSTAYNLAAGGPILYPTMSNLILTPICPFTLTNRPIILPDSDTVCITMRKAREEKVTITFDGQVGFDLKYGDKVMIHASNKRIRLLKSPDQTYFEILRAKLMWGGATYKNHDGNG